ncbi:MAG: N,N-dimethylformamidase beta subunit family domain-containing protein [Chitinophagaceae bacterium]
MSIGMRILLPRRHAGIKIAILLSLLFSVSLCQAQNPIVLENANTGNPISEWGVPDFRDPNISGFATEISVNRGNTVHFKVTVAGGAGYTIKIYRLGYYNGNGARLITNLGSFTGTVQPTGIADAVTGSLDCGNWSESASWAIPGTAVSGFYIAKLERTGGGSNHIIFVVRNDAGTADLFFQTPDATWQAYNGYGGNYLYSGVTTYPSGHAVKISYNRPFFVYNSGFLTDNRESDWYMNAVYPMIRWLERNGYDINYTTSVETARNGNLLLNHKVFVSTGHDEYWSKEQRENVEAARAAGVNLAFFSGNEVYWKTRWEADASSNAFHTLVCYKEGALGDGTTAESTCGTKCDNTSTVWTGLWRTGAAYDAGRPENALTGQASWDGTPGAIEVPSEYKKLRFWRNTTIAALADGQVATLAPNTLGHEWDWEQYKTDYPLGRITMSKTTLNNHVHKLSLYKDASGALVFGAGTIQWSWGLDGAHAGGTATISNDMQQATVNLFADMEVQPGSLQSDLLPASSSTDNLAPTSLITTPLTGTTVSSGSNVTITGTATDAGPGVVAGVEVSVDGGTTWQIADITDADNTVSYTFTWPTTSQGTKTIKVRAFDDSGNIEAVGVSTTVTVGMPVCPCSIFVSTDVPAPTATNLLDPSGSIEVGVKFKSNTNGYVIGMKFYKSTLDVGTHLGTLWTTAGVQLAQATFTSESASGWQQVLFSSPVSITAGTTYVVSYHSPTGRYAGTTPFYGTSFDRGPLSAIATSDPDGPNGVFTYSPSTIFPNQFFNATNYWVDAVFATSLILPVELVDFTAHAENKDVKLVWTTSSEQNNRGFEVQRSNGGSDWKPLGFVNGAGTTTIETSYSYFDRDITPGIYNYRLKQVDIDGRFKFSKVVTVSINTKAVLYQNYPNPFDGTTTIRFDLDQRDKIKLSVFDGQGRLIAVLADGVKPAGTHTVQFDGRGQSSHLYYYKLETESSGAFTKKLIVR